MPRKKTPEDFPMLPVPIADFILYRENAIRAAVCEARQELSLLSASKLDGKAKGGRVSDRTAAAALKRAGALPCVILDNGEKITSPESWLDALDAVRERAKGCNNPAWIFEEWRDRYEKGLLYIGETRGRCLPLSTVQGSIISWLRYHLLIEARARGLVSFPDAAIFSAVEAAAG